LFPRHLSDTLILIRGGGDLATGVAHRLHRAGYTVMITELPQPLCVRRAVSFAEAVFSERATVEGVTAHLAPDPMVGMAYTVLDESLAWNEDAFKTFAKTLAAKIKNLSDLVSVYHRHSAGYRNLVARLAATDRLIDRIVYRLYGLSEEEIAVVEGR
jgi:hypothetical protein